MKTSIALCTYNGEKFLKAQLDSFLRQTKIPDELIVCDDFSTDSTIEILKNFEKKSSFPVQIEINQKQLGVSKNFEKAISLCKNEVVFLSDQDDIWMEEKIQIVTKEFEENQNLGMIFTNAELIDENAAKLNKTLFEEIFKKNGKTKPLFDLCLNRNVVTGATLAFRQKYCEKFMPIPNNIPNLIHDGWIALVISAITECKCLEKPLIKYRQHIGQQLGLFRKSYENSIERLEQEINILQNFPDYFENEFLLERLKEKKDTITKIIAEKSELIEHYQVRKELPKNHLKRFLPVFAEILNGRYAKFSNGLNSVFKDLIESKSNLK